MRSCNFCCAFIIKHSSKFTSESNKYEEKLSIKDLNDNLYMSNLTNDFSRNNSALNLINPLPANNILNTVTIQKNDNNTLFKQENLVSTPEPYNNDNFNDIDYRLEYFSKFCLTQDEENSSTSEYFIIPDLSNKSNILDSKILNSYYNTDMIKGCFPINSSIVNSKGSYHFIMYLSSIYKTFIHPLTGLKLKTNRIHLKLYQNTFLGSQVIEWILKNRREISSKIQAIAVGQAFLDFKYIFSSTHIPTNNNQFGFTNRIIFDEHDLYRPGMAAVRGVEALKNEELDLYLSHNPILMTIDMSRIDESIDNNTYRDSLTFKSLLQSRRNSEEKFIKEDIVDNEMIISDAVKRCLKFLENFEMKSVQNDKHNFLDQIIDDHLWEMISQQIAYHHVFWSEQQPLFERIKIAHNIYILINFLTRSLKFKSPSLYYEEPYNSSYYRQFLWNRFQEFELNQQIKIKRLPNFEELIETKVPNWKFTYWFNLYPGIIFTYRLVHKEMIEARNKQQHNKLRQFTPSSQAQQNSSNIIFEIEHPSILMLKGPLEFMRYGPGPATEHEGAGAAQQQSSDKFKLISLEPVIMQERDYFKSVIARISLLNPDIVFVQGIASHTARKLFIEANIPLFHGIGKQKLFEDIALVTGADIVPSAGEGSQLAMLKPRLGLCKRIRIKKLKFVEKRPSYAGADGGILSSFYKNVVFLESCPPPQAMGVFTGRKQPHHDFFTVVVDGTKIKWEEEERDKKYYRTFKNCIRFSLLTCQHLLILQSTVNKLKSRYPYDIPESSLYYPRLISYKDSNKHVTLIHNGPAAQGDDELVDYENKFEHLMRNKDRLLNGSNPPGSGPLEKHELYAQVLEHLCLSINPGTHFTPPILDDMYLNEIVDTSVKSLFPPTLYYTNKWAMVKPPICSENNKPRSVIMDSKSSQPNAFKINTSQIFLPLSPISTEDYLSSFRYNKHPPPIQNEWDGDKCEEQTLIVARESSIPSQQQLLDCFDASQTQQISFLFYSFPNPINNAISSTTNSPNYCISPRIVTAQFYRNHDIDLRTFLLKYCFNPDYVCPGQVNGCRRNRCSNHVRRFVHSNLSVDILIHTTTNAIPIKNDLHYWTACQACGSLLQCFKGGSGDLWDEDSYFLNMSFAAFLQTVFSRNPILFPDIDHSCLCSGLTKRSSTKNNEPPSSSSNPNPIIFFRLNQELAIFTVSNITVGVFDLPGTPMNFNASRHEQNFSGDVEYLTLTGYNVFNIIDERLSIYKNELQFNCLATTDTTLISSNRILSKINDHLNTLEKERLSYRNVLDQCQILLTKQPAVGLVSDTKPTTTYNNEYDFMIQNLLVEAKALVTKSIHYWNTQLTELSVCLKNKTLKTGADSQKSENNKAVPTISSSQMDQLEKKPQDITVSSSTETSDSTNQKYKLNYSLLLNGTYEPIANPFKNTEHFHLPFNSNDHVRVIVSEEIPSSIIAYSLSCLEYEGRLKEKYNMEGRSKEAPGLSSNFLESSYDSAPVGAAVSFNPHIDINFTDSLSNAKFSCKIYYAIEFAKLRARVFPYPNAQYCRSLSHSSKWYSGGGKSGSRFWKTRDNRFLVKEIFRLELQSFLEFAPHYTKYMENCCSKSFENVSNRDKNSHHAFSSMSSLARVVGAYRISFKNSSCNTQLKQQDVIVMENLFYERPEIVDIVYDLKGSIRNRLVNLNKATTVAQDKSAVSCQPSSPATTQKIDEMAHSSAITIKGENNNQNNSLLVLLDENFIRLTFDSPLYVHPFSKVLLTAVLERDTAFLAHHDVMDYSLLVAWDASSSRYIIGMVDYIHTFTWDKKLEMLVKRSGILGGQGKMPTIISPAMYRQRFLEAINRYFLTVPDHWYGLSVCSNI